MKYTVALIVSDKSGIMIMEEIAQTNRLWLANEHVKIYLIANKLEESQRLVILERGM